ncbi:retrotransposon protein, putative, ty1-copia subclass [Tanacetum coccineum]
MLQELKSMFEKQARVERFDLIQTFHACKQEEGKPVAAYVLHMKGYVDQLECLGYMLPQDLLVGLILNGLTKDFARFVRNYNMHNMGKTIGELHAMLIEYEKGLAKKAKTSQGNDKQVYIPKPKNPKPSAKEHPAKDDTCHHCKEVGHWKRNCPVYLVEVLMKKKQVDSASSLDNCHYAPSITRGVVSFHRLVENGFVQCFTDIGISVSKNNVHYFNVIPSNGIYEIDMHDLVPNVNFIYNVSTKRAKHNLDSTYLWHYRHAHISKKHIEKIQQEGLLKSTDDESFDQCVSCLSGKMTRKSHVSRQGASYFIKFTDDYSRYGYVYLLKHKHEVFETFKLTPPYTPQHNGVSERRNRTLLDMVRSMMILTTLPLSFWDYALEFATRILNMVPTKKVWGCKALVKRDTPEKHQQRSVKCIFIGYPKETMGYYFYIPPENKIVVARYAEFFEKNLITQEVSRRAIDLEEIHDEDTSPFEITSEIPMEVEGFEPPQEEVILIRRSERTHRAPDRLCLNVEVEEHSLGDLNEPIRYKAAMLDSESNKWIDAMNVEIQSMIDNMTDMDGIVHTYKARLVAKGYTQLYRVDYEETFSPVADIRAIGFSYLKRRFVDPNHPRKVCKLQRSIYGLKQASRSWNRRFDEEIKKFCFAQNLDEPCVYQKASGSNVIFLILYVDDIIIMEIHILSLQSVKDYLGKYFAMKDLGEAAFILGIKIYRDRSKRLIGLGQNAYIDKILKRYKMDNSKRGHIPMKERLDLNKTQGLLTASSF